MNLLFDQNLSPRLVHRLSDVYLDASHVSSVGMDCAGDDEIWRYARANDYMVVTSDADFSDLAALHGFPPKVIWLRFFSTVLFNFEGVAGLRKVYSIYHVPDGRAVCPLWD